MSKIHLFFAALMVMIGVVACEEEPIEPDGPEQSTALKVLAIDPTSAPVGEKVVITGENIEN